MISRSLVGLGCWLAIAAAGCGDGFSAGDGQGAAGQAGAGGGAGAAGHGGSAAGGAGAAGSAGSSGQSGAAGAAGSAAACATDFCATFDDVSTPASSWDVSEVVGSGVIQLLAASSAPSAPNVLAASVAVGDPSTNQFHSARLSLQPSDEAYATSTPKLELVFSFSAVETDAQDAWASIANFRYGVGEHYLVVAIERATPTEHRVVAFPAPEGEPRLDLGVVEIGSWQRVRMTIPKRSAPAGSPAGGGATVELDGAPKTLSLPPAALTPDLRFDLGLGISSGAGGDFVVHYDDVAITYTAP